jgi:hypothetical protein
MYDASAAIAPSASPRFLWNEIVRWTFEACVRRREGREAEVRGLLHERLPALIRAWSARSGLSGDGCREQLRSLFARAQECVELGSIQRRLIVEEVCSRLGPAAVRSATRPAAGEGGLRLRRRVPIDDIPAMLDALAEAEFESLGESVLPLRSVLTPPRELFAAETAVPAALSA